MGCGVIWDSRESFSLYYLNSKVRKIDVVVGWVQSAEYRLAEREHGASTLLGLAPPTFVGILTPAFKSATTTALTAGVWRIFALDMVRPHGFLCCAINCRLKTFGVRTLCGDLCSESIQRVWWDVYLVASFQHQLYTIRRKHLFA